MIKVKELKLRKILNSEGKDAIETEIIINKNIKGIASTPSAIIPGKREIISKNELNKNELSKMFDEIYNIKIENQEQFDNIINKYKNVLGANVCLSLSLAFARAYSKMKKTSLVKYISKLGCVENRSIEIKSLVTIFSSGVHNKSVNGDIQNIMISVDIQPFSKAVKAIIEIYNRIEKELKDKNLLKGYGTSSGMIVEKFSTEEKFEILSKTIKKLDYDENITIAIDVAAEHFYKNNFYTYQGKKLNSKKLYNTLKEYIKKYNITYIEDPFDSNDEIWWEKIKNENPNILIFGDDIFATQDKYINKELANGIVIKMNQVGTLTDTINTFENARKSKMSICISHRSIETEDTFMCDLAIGLRANYIKIGGPRRGDRIAKYNQLLRLE